MDRESLSCAEADLIVDYFAGGGGASEGIRTALRRKVNVAINHCPAAIAMHEANHPETKHLKENVWDVDPVRDLPQGTVGVAWFSPTCTHFSRARGGKPVSKQLRALPWVATRFAKARKPSVIFLENVPEFITWGPIGADNQPVASKKGATFRAFVRRFEALGYVVEWRVLNAADYGAPTHRKRLFLVARRDGKPIVWPAPTHGPGRPLPYRTAAECIDWNVPCKSLFGRTRPLAHATQRLWNFLASREPIDHITNPQSTCILYDTLERRQNLLFHHEELAGIHNQDPRAPILPFCATDERFPVPIESLERLSQAEVEPPALSAHLAAADKLYSDHPPIRKTAP